MRTESAVLSHRMDLNSRPSSWQHSMLPLSQKGPTGRTADPCLINSTILYFQFEESRCMNIRTKFSFSTAIRCNDLHSGCNQKFQRYASLGHCCLDAIKWSSHSDNSVDHWQQIKSGNSWTALYLLFIGAFLFVSFAHLFFFSHFLTILLKQ